MRRWSPRAALVAALAFGCFATICLAIPGAAAGQSMDAVVEVRGCDAGDALVAAIRVELAATSTPIAKVTAVCLPESRVLVVAFPTAGGKPAAREVDVADVSPDARTRSVAIATGELFQSLAGAPVPPPAQPGPSLPPLPLTPPPTPAAPAPIVVQVAAPAPVALPPAVQVERAPHAWTVGGAMHARTFPMNDTTLIGPSVELDLRLGASPLHMRLASDVAFAERTAAFGDASITAWTGSIALSVHTESGPLTFDAGPFVEGGGAFVRGTARSPGAATEGSGSTPLALVGAQAIIGGRFDPFVPYLAIDAGGALAGAEATVDDDAVLTVAGPFVGVRLGLAFAP